MLSAQLTPSSGGQTLQLPIVTVTIGYVAYDTEGGCICTKPFCIRGSTLSLQLCAFLKIEGVDIRDGGVQVRRNGGKEVGRRLQGRRGRGQTFLMNENVPFASIMLDEQAHIKTPTAPWEMKFFSNLLRNSR